MHLDTASCQSPAYAPADGPFFSARPETLAYSFTLPADPRSPGIARAVTRAVLPAHGLAEMTDVAVQAVSELTACACRFSPTEVYLSLRYRESALRVTFYDGHARHTHPRLTAACALHRRATLRLLDRVVRDAGGDWGIGGGGESGVAGTRMWAVLPGSPQPMHA
ncbi:ATP-binding protein [Streptomyces sp. NPDC002328]|uniref:ATP-binding protein n=1 Tax=Streptomyces sp. NPDC002328 TaxID=3364642 RepID=UPI00368B44E5